MPETTSVPAGPKPGPLSPAANPPGVPQASPPAANTLPIDSRGRSLEVGDSVNLQATVTGVGKDGEVNLRIDLPNSEKSWSVSAVAAGAVTHSGLNPRIGAAPQLRTPAVEIPAKAGGVKPVARDEFNRDNKTESTAGLPTATAQAAGRIAAA